MASGWYTYGKRMLLEGATVSANIQPVASNYFFNQATQSLTDISPYYLGDNKLLSSPTWALNGSALEFDYTSSLEWYEGELPQTGSLGGFVFYDDDPVYNVPFFYLELDEAIVLNGESLTINFTGSYQARI